MKGTFLSRVWGVGLSMVMIIAAVSPVWAQDADLDTQPEVKAPVTNIAQPVRKEVKKKQVNAIQKK